MQAKGVKRELLEARRERKSLDELAANWLGVAFTHMCGQVDQIRGHTDQRGKVGNAIEMKSVESRERGVVGKDSCESGAKRDALGIETEQLGPCTCARVSSRVEDLNAERAELRSANQDVRQCGEQGLVAERCAVGECGGIACSRKCFKKVILEADIKVS